MIQNIHETLFDQSAEYEAMLGQGLRLSGEDMHFFIRGRVAAMVQDIGTARKPERILDFGCGIGHATAFIAREFPQAEVVGVDISEASLQCARSLHRTANIRFQSLSAELGRGTFDLCYTNGVFHHIPPAERKNAMRRIHRALKPRGWFALFENNPWNPGTRLVMRRIPFDRFAITINPPACKTLVEECGFQVAQATRHLFFFPRQLGMLRPVERWFEKVPLGAQYYILASTP